MFKVERSNFVKLALVLVFFCFAECAAGSCMSYGHSCWGGHGKRNGIMNKIDPNKGIVGGDGNDLVGDRGNKWFLNRLLQQNFDPSLKLERENFGGEQKHEEDDGSNNNENEEMKSIMDDNELSPLPDEYDTEINQDEGQKSGPEGRILRVKDRLKFLKFLRSVGRLN